MSSMTEKDREEFLSKTRLGVLSTLTSSGAPISVPIWFEWDGERARMFTSSLSPKVRRIEADARASLLVAAGLGEPEIWVAIDGTIETRREGALELAERLAARYWDLNDEKKAATLQLWRDASGLLLLLEIVPTRVRSYRD